MPSRQPGGDKPRPYGRRLAIIGKFVKKTNVGDGTRFVILSP
ncbi:MAG: hypothetical protein ACKVE4_03615 [Dissulfuribacterales bacterium]